MTPQREDWARLDEWPRRGAPLVIGVAGGSGSGKTTIAEAVIDVIGPTRAALIQHDSYYRDQSHLPPEARAKVNYDHPDSLETELLAEHVRMLRAGHSVDKPVYDFTVHTRADETELIEPCPLLIVEGILVLADAALRDLMDLKIYVDTDSDLRLMRRLTRDLTERKRSLESVLTQYTETVRPMHLQFVAESKRYADLIIPGGYNENAVATVVSMIRNVIDGDRASRS